MKRHLPITAALFCVAVAQAADDDKFEYNGLNYQVISEKNHEVMVAQNENITGAIEIPSDAVYGSSRYSVTAIGEYAFFRCGGMTSVTIPSSVTNIGGYAFGNCNGLTTVTIPSSVTYIGSGPFSDCSNLAEIIVEKGNKNYVAIDGVLFNIDKTRLVQCPGTKTSVSIPYTVADIGWNAFSGCRGLTSVVIPSSVIEIGLYAFSGCSNLESVVISENARTITFGTFLGCVKLNKIYNMRPTPQSVDDEAFDQVPGNAVVYVPKGRVNVYSEADGWNYFRDFREMGAFDITMSNDAVELAVGETVTLKAEVTKDADMTVKSSEWTTSDPAVATVDQAGKVTAVAPGQAVIYFTATDGYGVPHTESCLVGVTESSAIEDITVDANAPVEVYTISGIRVADTTDNLPAGIYIVRQGNVAKKIAVK